VMLRRRIANPAPRRIAVYNRGSVSAWQAIVTWTHFASVNKTLLRPSNAG